MENTPAHMGKMEEQLKHWGAQLDHLVAKVEKAGADVLFAPGLPDLASVRAVCGAVSKPVARW